MFQRVYLLLSFLLALTSRAVAAPHKEESAEKELPILKIGRTVSVSYGQTVWCEPSKIKYDIFYSYQGLKAFPYESSFERSITLSSLSHPRACLCLAGKLRNYNQRIMGPEEVYGFSNAAIPPGLVRLDRRSGSMMCDVEELFEHVSNKGEFFETLLKSAAYKGGKRVYTTVPKANGKLLHDLIKRDFRLVNDVDSIRVSEPAFLLTKDLTQSQPTPFDAHWALNPSAPLTLAEFQNQFGAFLRGPKGNLLGGIFGNI